MLFNELYYYYSNNFNVTSFVKENFKTYFLKNGNVLDDRENYQKYILSSEIKVSNEPRVDGCRAFSKTKKIR